MFRYNIFDDHPHKPNEVIIRKKDDLFLVLRTDENNMIIDNEQSFTNENDAINNFIKQLKDLKKIFLSEFIGKNYLEYYKEKFIDRKIQKIFISWNWPPFFIGYGWLLYRKLYLEATIVILSSFIIGGFFAVLNLGDFNREIASCFKIIIALMGNYVYYQKINRTIKKLDEIDGKNHLQYLKGKGGTNIVPAIVIELFFVGLFVLSLIL